MVLDIVAAGLLWWFAGRPRPTSAAISATFTAVGLCVLIGLATTIVAMHADVLTLVPADHLRLRGHLRHPVRHVYEAGRGRVDGLRGYRADGSRFADLEHQRRRRPLQRVAKLAVVAVQPGKQRLTQLE